MIDSQQQLIEKLLEIQNRFDSNVQKEIQLRNLQKSHANYDVEYDKILTKAQNTAQTEIDNLDLDKVANEIMLSNSPRGNDKRPEAEVDFIVSQEPSGAEFKNLKAFENADIAAPNNKRKRQDSPNQDNKEILNSKNIHQLKYKLAYKPGQKPKLTATPRFRAAPRPAGM